MVDNPNAQYFRTSQGSLTGFESFTPPSGEQDLVKVGWSIEQLRAFLNNESGLNFPNEEWVKKIDGLINNHLKDYDNPHHVSLDQITQNFVREILGNIVPGTAPDLPPFFAYDSICSLPLGEIFPVTFSSSNFYRMTEGDVFVNPSSESELMGTDGVSSEQGIPLFESMTNTVPVDWYSQSTTPINTTLIVDTPATISYPFNFYRVVETNTTGSFGVFIPTSRTVGDVCTLTAFIIPTVNVGSLQFSQSTDVTKTVTIDLVSGKCVSSTSDIKAESFQYASGVIRVSFTYKVAASQDFNTLRILHINNNETTTDRAGVQGRPLFWIGQPTNTKSMLNHPVMINLTQPAYTSPLVLKLNKIPVPSYLPNALITMSLTLYQTLPEAVIADTSVLSFGPLTITRDQVNIYVKMQGATIFQTEILNGKNIFTLSVSPTTIIFKSLKGARQTAYGTYPSLTTAAVSVGKCAGYLHSMAFYAMSDTTSCVEFLTNG